ncbi:uncharacterized protein LOC110180310 [Drosophila serrata]|uniref:uncharacterized protein LOC110180310 n=1 Tax=Drosophila serrata TaxID=7274 RepID=UPI000A1D2AA6|nr:uncharacterized protein LOC110180310 [Drosophila serrata]
MLENCSCPNCNARSLIRKRYLTISRMKKLKMDLAAIFFCRLYCPVGMYKIVFRCPSCGWKGDQEALY